MIVKLLTEHYLEVLSLKGRCTGSSESTLVKMPLCWKSHVVAQLKLLPMTSKPFRKCASLVVILCSHMTLHDVFWQFVENWN